MPVTKIVCEARKTASETLLESLKILENTDFSEQQLSLLWREKIKNKETIFNSGWYSPPPFGISVLIGNAPNYKRLEYTSLREPQNWPNQKIKYSKNDILYPYFSIVDKKTKLLGDFVGTFYQGDDTRVKNWIKKSYHITMQIAEFVQTGQKLSEIYNFSETLFKKNKLLNNTYSQSGGLAADIGHSIPYFSETKKLQNHINQNEIFRTIADKRTFVSKNNHKKIPKTFALTIEPQLIDKNLPMVSFHIIVLFENGKKTICTEYERLFKYFGMNKWIY